MKFDSNIVYKLSDNQVAGLTAEVQTFSDQNLWTSHFTGDYEKTGALRRGKTVWLRNIDREMNITFDQSTMYPESFKILDKFSQERVWGRAYWHKIVPGGSIDLHSDDRLGFSNFVDHRYQVYLSVPQHAEIYIDDGAFDPRSLGNCVLDFNMYRPHRYANHSDTDFIFMVFDVFKPGVTLKVL